MINKEVIIMNENLDRKILGENIKKRRIELGLTQKKLASNLGVSNVSLSQYETGDVNIPLATLNELANILETTVGKLIGTKEEIEYTTMRKLLTILFTFSVLLLSAQPQAMLKNEKIKMLEEIKIQSENKNKDKLLLERANRIYAEIVNTEIRNHISDYLENYQMVVATGDRIRIQKAKESFSQFLDKIDPEMNDLGIDDILLDINENEDEEIMEEDELEFWN